MKVYVVVGGEMWDFGVNWARVFRDWDTAARVLGECIEKDLDERRYLFEAEIE